MLFVAIDFRYPPKRGQCRPKFLERKVDAKHGEETRVYTGECKKGTKWPIDICLPCRAGRTLRLQKASSGAFLIFFLCLFPGCVLHGTAIEHVEHAGISRAASISIVADKVIDAHAGPAGGLRGRRGSSAVTASWWRWLQWRLVVGRGRGARGGGSLGMWRRRSAAWLIAISTLGRALTRGLRGVVRLGGRWRGRRVRSGRRSC